MPTRNDHREGAGPAPAGATSDSLPPELSSALTDAQPGPALFMGDMARYMPALLLGFATINGIGFLVFVATHGFAFQNLLSLVAAILLVASAGLARMGHSSGALRLTFWGSWLLVCAWGLLIAGVRSPALVALPLLVMAGGWLLPRREVFMLAGASIGAMLLLTWSEEAGWLAPRVTRGIWAYCVSLATATVLALGVALVLNEAFVRQYRRLANVSRSLRHLAWHDPLTGLPNRASMLAYLDSTLTRSARDNYPLAVLFIDLDDFKNINDSFGHTAGDYVLTVVASRLQEEVRASDSVARFGGDEFIAVLHGLPDAVAVGYAVERILTRLGVPILLETGREVHANASVGIALFPSDGGDAETLIRNADTAMYRAKAQGRWTFSFYEQAMTEQARQRIKLEGLLRHAVARGELRLAFQAQVNMADHGLVGAEALVRWDNPELGWVMPDDFIPLAEEIGVIASIGEWVLGEACRTWRNLADQGLTLPKLAINISALQLEGGCVLAPLEAALEKHGVPPRMLQLEITESALMGAGQEVECLAKLRARGMGVAVDDFGTGHSSLARLKSLPLDALKIDRSFTGRIGVSSDDEIIARLILRLAETLNLEVVAEGVESREQEAFLLASGCRIGQGNLYGMPLPQSEFFQHWSMVSGKAHPALPGNAEIG
ncbi:MAG: EAL domain-containing protein [Rhodocyclaceae bacterium]|nr:EAL domain-containing protein [Rhodocyclaceae bacterium]